MRLLPALPRSVRSLRRPGAGLLSRGLGSRPMLPPRPRRGGDAAVSAGQPPAAPLLSAAGLSDVDENALEVRVEHHSFEGWWEPFTRGVGPAGAFVAALSEERRGRLRARCRELLPPAPFTVTAVAWAARGLV